jgi:predicted dehydrogenase
MSRLRIAVIGVGHLGKEHARILAGMPEVELVGVVDTNAEQAQAIARRYGTTAYADYWPLLNLVDAATIVVPTTHHHAVAREFLSRGIPLLVEKPLAATITEANDLVDLAHERGIPLQVGHIERFNPAFEELQRRPLQPKFISCERLGPFTGRSMDIGAVLDLMIHDLDLLLALVQAPATDVSALGVALFGKNEDLANARVTFANGCVADLTASRANTAPSRQMRIFGPEGYVGIDFARRRLTMIQPSEQLRRQGINTRKLDPAALALLKNEMFGRHLEVLHLDCNRGDQLTNELEHFVDCVRTGARPRVSGEDGRDAVALATRILDSIRTHAWNGTADGPTGPTQLPTPSGALFPSSEAEGEVAA